MRALQETPRALGTNPATAEASRAALEHAGERPKLPLAKAHVAISAPAFVVADPLELMGVSIMKVDFGQDVAELTHLPNWPVDLGKYTATATPLFVLNGYIKDKKGVNVMPSMVYAPDKQNMALLQDAGITFVELASDLAAREILYEDHPYVRQVSLKFSPDEDHFDLAHKLAGFAPAQPPVKEVFGRTYAELIGVADANKSRFGPSLSVRDMVDQARAIMGPSDPKQPLRDMLRGIVSEYLATSGMYPAPSITPSNLVEAIYESMALMSSKMLCADKTSPTVKKTCVDWIETQLDGTKYATLAECKEAAMKKLPAFIAIYQP
jgi:hypothetical protein